MLGFETIGNATITVFDGDPVITTDPWVFGKPYFGSWGHKFKIPNNQLANIKKSKYVWLSHGHPDHIDPDSFDLFKNKKIIIADHYGDRIYNDLKSRYECIKLKSNEWFEISKHVRIKSFADWNQDSSLLVEINKKDIIFNLNDGSALGWSKEIKKIIKEYKNRFLLKLINWGDADMINFYNHHNEFVSPLAAEKKPCGLSYSYYMKKWNCNFALPFSSMHKYIRNDSFKMNEYATPLKDHFNGFKNYFGELLPAFIIWDSNKENYIEINPKKNDEKMKNSEEFGDNWSDDLEKNDKILISDYFKKFEHIKDKFGFLSFKVGETEFNIKLSNKKEGIIFESPRNSLICSISNQIFDDMLIGNFMKVKLVNTTSLYPNFTPYVTKYGDNGKSFSKKELKKYFNYYQFKSTSFWVDYLKIKTEDILRPKLERYKPVYFLARTIKRKIT